MPSNLSPKQGENQREGHSCSEDAGDLPAFIASAIACCGAGSSETFCESVK